MLLDTSERKTDFATDQHKDSNLQISNGLNPLAAASFGDQIEEPKAKGFDPAELFTKSILDQTKDYPPPVPLLYLVQNGERHPHRTKGSFSLQQGKQKSKKTTELALEVAAYISKEPSEDNIYFECAESGTVLFFDCEQGVSYAARTMKLILKLANLETCDSLVYCDLREFTPEQRVEVIEAGIEAIKDTRWVIIDGIVDVMNDFMSAEEGHQIITHILRLCSKYDIHITGVLHQNKGQSKDARAHVGSIAGQKCEVEIMVERDPDDKELSVVSAKESRGLPFEDFAIRWEKGGLPYIVQSAVVNKTEAKKAADTWSSLEDHRMYKLLTEVYTHGEKFTYSQLVPQMKIAYKNQHQTTIGDNKVKDMITKCKNEKWLIQEVEKGPYILGSYTGITIDDDVQEDEDEPF